MRLRLLRGPAEVFHCVLICTCDYFAGKQCHLCGGPPRKQCCHCGDDFDLRPIADFDGPAHEAFSCGVCRAKWIGGQAGIDAYIAAHPKRWPPALVPA